MSKPFSFDELLGSLAGQIQSRVWDFSFDPGSNDVDVYVGYLRGQINRPGLVPLPFAGRGAGYRFVEARD